MTRRYRTAFENGLTGNHGVTALFPLHYTKRRAAFLMEVVFDKRASLQQILFRNDEADGAETAWRMMRSHHADRLVLEHAFDAAAGQHALQEIDIEDISGVKNDPFIICILMSSRT